MQQERIRLAAARREYAEEFRRANPWTRGLTNPFNLTRFVRYGEAPTTSIFGRFNEEAYKKRAEGIRLAALWAKVESAADAYAHARTGKRTRQLGRFAETADFRKALEISRARREARMTLFERSIGKTVRSALKTRERALATAVVVGGLFVFIYVSPAVAAVAGGVKTVSALGGVAFQGARSAGRYGHYAWYRLKDFLRIPEREGVQAFAKKYNRRREFFLTASFAGGIGLAELIQTSLADASAEAVGLDSSHEHLRETVVNTREHLIRDIDKKHGYPAFMPMGRPEHSVLDAALSENGALEAARRSSPALRGLFERLREFQGGHIHIKNDDDNVAFLNDGIAHLKRLEMLEAAHLRAANLPPGSASESLMKQIAGDLARERDYAHGWSGDFDARSAWGAASFHGRHHESVAWLTGEYFGASFGHPPAHIAESDVVPPQDAVAALPLSAENFSAESFVATRAEIIMRLDAAAKVADAYRRIIGENDDTYRALLGSQETYKNLLARLDTLAPTFSRLDEVRAELGDGHTGALADELLRDRVRQIDFNAYGSHWPSVVAAAERVHALHRGEIFVGGEVAPLDHFVDFKQGAYPDFPPAMAHTVYEMKEALEKKGWAFEVKEGFHPASHIHHSECHYNGTCADFGSPDREYSPKFIANVFSYVDTHKSLEVTFETPSRGEEAAVAHELMNYYLQKGLPAAEASRLVNEHVKFIPWGTAPHFHFHCKDCEPEGVSPLPVLPASYGNVFLGD